MQKVFGLILFSKAESCQSFIYHFTLDFPSGTNLISYLSATLLLLLATPHRKSSTANFFCFLVSISREQKEIFQQKFANFLIILKNINLGLYALRPQNEMLSNRDSHSVGHVESAIFHSNIAIQQGHVENCGSLHPYFHQEQKKFWHLVPSGDNLCWKI